MNPKIREKVLVISREEIPQLVFQSSQKDQFPDASKKLFGEFLQINPDCLGNFERATKCVFYEGADLNIVSESITIQGVEISSTACALKKGEAINITSTELIKKILEIDPDLIMPRYAVGLTNYRGHCFFIPVFVPLFNFKPFVEALLKGFEKATDFLTKNQLSKPEKISKRKDHYVEDPFLWTRILKKFFLKYKKASLTGEIKILNLPKNINLAYPDLYSTSYNHINQEGYKPDLGLDRALMKVLLELRSFQSERYATPGGHSPHLYYSIMEKLNKEYENVLEESPFSKVCFVGLTFDYTCLKCMRVNLRQKVLEPCLLIPHKHSDYRDLQELIDDPLSLVKYQDLSCKQKKIGNLGDICPGIAKNICNVKIVNTPILLAFAVADFEQNEIFRLKVPDDLIFNGKKFKKIAYTDNFECWADKDGKLRSIRKIKPQAGDKSAGWHIVVNMLTQSGWMEINNNEIFISKKETKFAVPGDLIFFCQEDEISYIPKAGNHFDEQGNYIKTCPL